MALPDPCVEILDHPLYCFCSFNVVWCVCEISIARARLTSALCLCGVGVNQRRNGERVVEHPIAACWPFAWRPSASCTWTVWPQRIGCESRSWHAHEASFFEYGSGFHRISTQWLCQSPAYCPLSLCGFLSFLLLLTFTALHCSVWIASLDKEVLER